MFSSGDMSIRERQARDPAIASWAKKGEFVKDFDHFDLRHTARN